MTARHVALDRRTLLALAAGAGGALLLPREARAQSATSGLLELSSRPTNYEAPLSALTQRITPVESFFVRAHFDAPTVDVASWRLAVGGVVDAPRSFGLADLEKLPQHEVEAVLQCAGNGRALLRPRIPGVQWQKGAVGSARWSGPRVKDLLALAKPRAEGTMLELEGLDRPTLPSTPRFIRGIPLQKGLHEDTIVALRMNGAPLTPLHGAPARLVVPGWVGDDWLKWLERITVIAGEPKGFYYETAYRFPSEPMEPGTAPKPGIMKPMERMNVKSIIGAPMQASRHRAGTVKVVGVAFSGEQRITKVEVALAGGAWQPAKIVDSGGRYGFSVFEHAFELAPGSHTIRARATDESGATQTDTAVWNPSGYLHNAIDSVTIEVAA